MRTPSSLFISLVSGRSFGELFEESDASIFFVCEYTLEAAVVRRESVLYARLPTTFAAQSLAAVHLVITTIQHPTVSDHLAWLVVVSWTNK
jgi:hypothetical protein